MLESGRPRLRRHLCSGGMQGAQRRRTCHRGMKHRTLPLCSCRTAAAISYTRTPGSGNPAARLCSRADISPARSLVQGRDSVLHPDQRLLMGQRITAAQFRVAGRVNPEFR
jgi:hypothetical protein